MMVVVVVTLGPVAGTVPPGVPEESSDEPDGVGLTGTGWGTEVVVAAVVCTVVGSLRLGAASPWRRPSDVAEAGAPARRVGRGELPDVATRSAMRASDTARMTHQFGRL